MKRRLNEKKLSKRDRFWNNVFDCIMDIDELAVIIVVGAIIAFPVILLEERREIRKFGRLDASIYCSNVVDYLWKLAETFKETCAKAPHSYAQSDGYIQTEKLCKALQEYRETDDTIEFIRYHISLILRVDSKDMLESMIWYLHTRDFKAANKLLEENVNGIETSNEQCI